MFYYYIDNNFGQCKSVDNDFDWLIIYHFCKSINDNKNQVIALTFLISRNI